MKRKVLILLAVVVVLATTVAAPAAATKGAIHGEIDVTLYLTPCDVDDPESPFLTWAGTVDFGRKTFGAAYFPAGDLVEPGDGWSYFEEIWTIFWLPRGELTEHKLIKAACNPRRVVMQGTDAGFNTPWGTAFGAGEVEYARGHFHRFVGGETFWAGEYVGEITLLPGQEFTSTMWLLPADMR